MLSPFNVFRYITFRTAYAILTALFLCFVLGPWLIQFLKRNQIGERIRDVTPETHRPKEGTPTMGGLLILFALVVPTLLWADLRNPFIWLVLVSAVGFGAIGFLDDYYKIFKRNETDGLKPGTKLLLQGLVALITAVFLYQDQSVAHYQYQLTLPFFKNVGFNLGILYIPFAVLVIVGCSNAVNLTDGLDGLAIGPITIAVTAYMVICYVTGHFQFATYLNIQHVPRAGELAVLCGAVAGASLGFLWFNSYPAEVFMGNVGSTALGGILGTVAVMVKQELLLMVIGGIFVVEALSVILQVASYKLTGKRVFLMAPLHHHFERLGWSEPKVTVRFWIVAIILALLSLSTLKLR
jgi:phospho-N-acetylmuramoyl-pentapeptide-transferase